VPTKPKTPSYFYITNIFYNKLDTLKATIVSCAELLSSTAHKKQAGRSKSTKYLIIVEVEQDKYAVQLLYALIDNLSFVYSISSDCSVKTVLRKDYFTFIYLAALTDSTRRHVVLTSK
jgi:hypothetical protein